MKLEKYCGRVAMAALGLCGACAHAQSSVTIYGTVDANVGRYKGANTGVAVGDQAVWKQETGGLQDSYLGIRGSEDLGDGWAAVFDLETFIRLDTGQSGRADATVTPTINVSGDPFWSRASWVGIESRTWGRVRLGQQATAIWLSSVQSNAFAGSTDFSPINLLMFLNSPSILAGGTRWSNAIAYDSPNMSGFTFALQAAPGEGSGGRNVGGRLTYANGPFVANLAYSAVKKDPITFSEGTSRSDTNNTLLGLSYDFKVVHVYAHAGRIKTDGSGTPARTDDNITHRIWEVSAAVPIGLGRFLIGYGQRKGNEVAPVSQRKLGSVGYAYNLSRRTELYALLRSDETRRQGATVDASGTSYALGVKHSF